MNQDYLQRIKIARLFVTVLIFSALTCAVVSSKAAFGQTEQASITGTIVDPSGSIVRGAQITLTNVATKISSVAVSNNNGYYTFTYLTPGTYELTVEAPGFSKSIMRGIHLTVNLYTSANITLKPGSIAQQVTVEAEAIQLETENAELGATIDRKQIIDLPQQGRNPYALLSLAPGVLPTDGGVIYDIINGGRSSTSSILLDGGSETDSTVNDVVYQPPLEAVGEFKLITSDFSAEFGRSSAGVVTASTETGTNTFHGSVYEYLQNSAFNANGWGNNHFGIARTAYRANNYGFSLGGPVWIPKVYNGRNRTFFFTDLEENPTSNPDNIVGTVPTAAERLGDFSGLVDENGNPIKIYDPETTTLVPGTAGQWSRSQFPNNVIPANRLNGIAQKVLQYYPEPNTPGLAQNFRRAFTRVTNQDNFFIRGDEVVNDKHKLFVHYGRSMATSSTPYVTIAYPSPGTSGDPGTLLAYATSGVISDTWTINPNLFAEFRGNVARRVVSQVVAGTGFNSGTLGFSPSLVSEIEAPIFPNFNIADVDSLGAQQSALSNDSEGSNEGQASITWVKGPQSLKAGFGYMFPYFNVTRPATPSGAYNFGRDYTQGPDPTVASADQGFGFATFLLGLPDGGQISKDPSLANSQKYSDVYIEDDWKMRPNFTVNLGLRYDLLGPWTERHNRLAYFDPTAPDAVTGTPGALEFVGVNGHPRGQKDTVYTNLSPRFGFALQTDRSTVIRSAFGVFYAPASGGIGNGVGDMGAGYQVNTPVYLGTPSAAPNTPPPGGALDNPFAGGYLPSPSNLVGATTYDPYRKGTIPVTYDYNLSIQRALAAHTVVTAAYSGSRGEHIWTDLSTNAAPIGYLSLGAKLNQQVPNPYAGRIQGALGASTVAYSQLLRPFRQYQDVIWNRDPVGDSYYNALTVQLQHQDTHGLFVQASYTFSKEIDDVMERFFNRAQAVINPNDLGTSRALAEWNRSQFIVINYVYDLPFGKGRTFANHGFTSYALGNWKVSGVTSYGAGLPVVIIGPNNTFLPDIGANADRLHDPHLRGGTQNPDHWFDTSAYAAAAPFTVGTGNRVEPRLNGPALGNWDIGMTRMQPFTETVSLALRFEFFNAFNNRALGNGGYIGPDGGVTDLTFGKMLGSGPGRNIQLGARLAF